MKRCDTVLAGLVHRRARLQQEPDARLLAFLASNHERRDTGLVGLVRRSTLLPMSEFFKAQATPLPDGKGKHVLITGATGVVGRGAVEGGAPSRSSFACDMLRR